MITGPNATYSTTKSYRRLPRLRHRGGRFCRKPGRNFAKDHRGRSIRPRALGAPWECPCAEFPSCGVCKIARAYVSTGAYSMLLQWCFVHGMGSAGRFLLQKHCRLKRTRIPKEGRSVRDVVQLPQTLSGIKTPLSGSRKKQTARATAREGGRCRELHGEEGDLSRRMLLRLHLNSQSDGRVRAPAAYPARGGGQGVGLRDILVFAAAVEATSHKSP